MCASNIQDKWLERIRIADIYIYESIKKYKHVLFIYIIYIYYIYERERESIKKYKHVLY